MLRILGWSVLLFLYWATVVHFLRSASPISIDGSGPVPSFHWGDMPLPTYNEYMRRKETFDLIYSIPYYLVGLLCTLIGYGVTPLVLPAHPPSKVSAFSRAAATTFALLVLLSIASDLGSIRNVWRAPLFLLHSDFYGYQLLALSKVFLPASILSGLLHCFPLFRSLPQFPVPNHPDSQKHCRASKVEVPDPNL